MHCHVLAVFNTFVHGACAVCGNIISKPKKLEGLQVGQLVSFRVEHVVEIHDDSASDDDY